MSFLNTLEGLVNQKVIDNSEFNSEEAFSELCFEMLSDTLFLPDFQHSYYFLEEKNNQNLKINGFALSEGEDILSLFISDIGSYVIAENMDKKNLILNFKQLYRVLNYVIRVNNQDVPKSHILSGLNSRFQEELKENLNQINLYLLTNKNAVNRKEVKSVEVIAEKDLDGAIDFNIRVVDLEELERLYKNNQSIDIEVSKYSDKPLLIMVPNILNLSYRSAISILPGNFLFNIYKEFGSRLLEKNVRSFLSLNKKVNKGIENTLINDPDMFLAYNNGLCVTVSNFELNDDGSVKFFKDFQIVNGGQTTSTIFFAKLKQKKQLNYKIDLDRVNVMTKITRIGRNIDSTKIQATISKNSNLQSAVIESDLSSNDEYLVTIHTYSKKYRSPFTNDYFYFERTRGQYNLESSLSKNKAFVNLFPKNQVFNIVDITFIYYLGFSNYIEPFNSVSSKEKRHPIFKKLMKDEVKIIDEDYYFNLMGLYILYKKFDSLYGKGDSSIGKIKKNVVAYGIALIQKDLASHNETIDFIDIWRSGINADYDMVIKGYLQYLNDFLISNYDDGRLDEACKKESTWNSVHSNFSKSELKNVIQIFTVCKKKKSKVSLSSKDDDLRYRIMLDEINSLINNETKYKNLIKCIEEEINNNSADQMSRYSRVHLSTLKAHFRALEIGHGVIVINPYNFDVYINECNGTKKKIEEVKSRIEEVYRIFTAVINDENFVN
jgi:hypothetical protein